VDDASAESIGAKQIIANSSDDHAFAARQTRRPDTTRTRPPDAS
jgi:hypothetical protein